MAITSRRRLGILLLGATGAVLTGMTAPAGADSGTSIVNESGPLVDLAPGTENITDGAWAQLFGVGVEGSGSRFVLVVRGLDASAAGTVLGAHLHTGPCIEGMPAAAAPHFNAASPAIVDADHEVWLDFKIRPGGIGISRTSVPFTIGEGGVQSLVIHVRATSPDGSAGARQACLPVEI